MVHPVWGASFRIVGVGVRWGRLLVKVDPVSALSAASTNYMVETLMPTCLDFCGVELPLDFRFLS